VTLSNSITSIGNYAFYECSELSSISLISSVSSIGEYAFYECSSLSSFTFPSSLKTIGDYAFQSSGLTYASFGSYLNSIGTCAFKGCLSLKYFSVSSSNSYLKSVDDALYSKNIEEFIQYPVAKTSTSFKVQRGVKTIDSYAFYSSNLEYISLPPTVTSICSGAFRDCSKLITINSYYRISTIENYAFKGCEKLSKFIIPYGVTAINSYTFNMCESLSCISIPSSVKSIGTEAFSYCSSLICLSIPSSVTSMQNYCFRYCTKLLYVHYYGTSNPGSSYSAQFTGCNINCCIVPSNYYSSSFCSLTPRKGVCPVKKPECPTACLPELTPNFNKLVLKENYAWVT
jgi:hypothetical protein